MELEAMAQHIANGNDAAAARLRMTRILRVAAMNASAWPRPTRAARYF
jgi:hypothetical protein